MSIDEVEEKFNLAQLSLMSVMQSISIEKEKEDADRRRKGWGKRPKNVGSTKNERNLNAFKLL